MTYQPIRVIYYGLGAISSQIAQLTAAQRGQPIVGGIDHDSNKAGRDLSAGIGLDQLHGAPVLDQSQGLLEATRPEMLPTRVGMINPPRKVPQDAAPITTIYSNPPLVVNAHQRKRGFGGRVPFGRPRGKIPSHGTNPIGLL